MIDYIEYELFGLPYKNNKTELKPLMWLTFKKYKKIDFVFKIISSNSLKKQAIDLFIGNDFQGNIFVDEKEIKLPKRKWRQLIFWNCDGKIKFWENLPPQQEIKVSIEFKQGQVSIRNGFENSIGDIVICDTDETAFAVESLSKNELILHCEETKENGDFDSLIFYMKVELEEEMNS